MFCKCGGYMKKEEEYEDGTAFFQCIKCGNYEIDVQEPPEEPMTFEEIWDE